MVKQIKAVFTKPLVILKSFVYRIIDKNKYLSETRLNICKTCDDKLDTSFGEVCDQCGCILANKTRIEDEHCDLCKW